MAERSSVALLFKYDENWVAGAYYLLNLIQALKSLPDHMQPEIVCYATSEKEISMLHDTGYPRLRLIHPADRFSGFEKIKLKFLEGQSGKMKLQYGILPMDAAYFFPFSDSPAYSLIPPQQRVFWIPDFQEKHLPHFFPDDYKSFLETRNLAIAGSKGKVVFSSRNALDDYLRFYPQQNTRNYVVHFAVTHPPTESVSETDIRKKFLLPEKWFFAPNQFWKHKNQPLIIRAIARLREQNIHVNVIFTGKEDDFRNPGYAEEVKTLARELGVWEQCRFLGFIDRAEQLWLMKNAQAVIQASLFEGWSTVVEDAKALQKFVILSDLEVHREQLQRGVLFFDPHDVESLALAIRQYLTEDTAFNPQAYREHVQEFGRNFLKVLEG